MPVHKDVAVTSGSTLKDGRSWAEWLGDTRIKFHHPCGHTSIKDYGKGPASKRMGFAGTKMMAGWWSRQRGGVVAPCWCQKKRKMV